MEKKNMFIKTRKSLDQKRQKKAVSTIIGYILLITFALVIAGAVYQWLKTYVPKEGLKCPDEVSLYVSDYAFDATLNELSLTLKNNGHFGIGGIFIYYSTSSSQEIASYDLSEKIKSGENFLNPGIALGMVGKNEFEPEENDKKIIFDTTGINYIYAVEITPIRWQEEKNKIQPVSCANAKTKRILDLEIQEGGFLEIIPEKTL